MITGWRELDGPRTEAHPYESDHQLTITMGMATPWVRVALYAVRRTRRTRGWPVKQILFERDCQNPLHEDVEAVLQWLASHPEVLWTPPPDAG